MESDSSFIPFNRPCIVGNEQKYIAEVIASAHLYGDGIFTKKSHAELKKIVGVPKVLLTTSCTHALEWFAARDIQSVQVVTQGRTISAQRLYQNCGFMTHSVQLWYHKWASNSGSQAG